MSSPWIPFPPTGTTHDDIPDNVQRVWVRMRGWDRRPFRAIWHTDGSFGGAPYATPTDDTWSEIPNYFVTWADLDAWHAE